MIQKSGLGVLIVILSFNFWLPELLAQPNRANSRKVDQILAEAKRIHGNDNSILDTYMKEDMGKCGLRLMFEIDKHWSSLSNEQQKEIQSLISSPQTETNRIIGHFKIFYDTSASSPNTPAIITVDLSGNCNRIPGTAEAFIDSAGKFFNEAWSFEIDTLGYTTPPLAADGYYHVNIVEFGISGIYGETAHNTPPIIVPGEAPKYLTYINIDNDFCDVTSKGMPGLKVTAAHEFHHAIQLGSYGEWVNDFYFYEITSTWIEDVVYDDVNDYYQYIRGAFQPPNSYSPRGQFATPDVSFSSYAGLIPYSRAIWGKFIAKRYGRDLMRQTWEHMKSVQSLTAIDGALNDNGSSLRQAFLEWTLWNYYTGPNADTVQFYTEGHQYPSIHKAPEITYSGQSRSFADTIEAFSSVYHPTCLLNSVSALCDTSPKMISIITNLNALASGNGAQYGFRYDISNSGDASYKQLSNGLFVRISVTDPANWSSQEIHINADSTSHPISRLYAETIVFPNPFHPNGSQLSFGIPSDSTSQSIVIVNIFSSSMDQIWSYEGTTQSSTCGNCLQWDGHDNNGNLVSSGIYFYVIMVNDRQYTGKFAVIKE